MTAPLEAQLTPRDSPLRRRRSAVRTRRPNLRIRRAVETSEAALGFQLHEVE